MGGRLRLAANESATFELRVAHVPGGTVDVIRDGAVIRRWPLTGDDQALSFEEPGDGKRHWIRIDVRDSAGKRVLIGNPIYIESAADAA